MAGHDKRANFAPTMHNRKAFHDYHIDAKLECGIALQGTEVKSLREGKGMLNEAYARVERGQLILYQCHIDPPWYSNTQIKFLGVYPLPWRFRISGNLQVLPSIPFTASYVATSAQIKSSLGRDLSAGATSTSTVDLIPNNTEFREGWNTQLDFRLSRNFEFRERWKFEPTLDLFNALNASSVLSANARYGPAWQNALVVLGGRVIKFGVQVNF